LRAEVPYYAFELQQVRTSLAALTQPLTPGRTKGNTHVDDPPHVKLAKDAVNIWEQMETVRDDTLQIIDTACPESMRNFFRNVFVDQCNRFDEALFDFANAVGIKDEAIAPVLREATKERERVQQEARVERGVEQVNRGTGTMGATGAAHIKRLVAVATGSGPRSNDDAGRKDIDAPVLAPALVQITRPVDVLEVNENDELEHASQTTAGEAAEDDNEAAKTKIANKGIAPVHQKNTVKTMTMNEGSAEQVAGTKSSERSVETTPASKRKRSVAKEDKAIKAEKDHIPQANPHGKRSKYDC
jgi:hypothetical protein